VTIPPTYSAILRSVLCDVAISSGSSVVARSVLCDLAISSNFSVIERNVLCDVAISSLECFVRIKKEKDEILTASRNEASG